MRAVNVKSRTVQWDNRHTFGFDRIEGGIRVHVNGRWWMPPKPFPPGFDQEAAVFDSIEHALEAIRIAFGGVIILWLDDDGHPCDVLSMSEFAARFNRALGLGPSRCRPRHRVH